MVASLFVKSHISLNHYLCIVWVDYRPYRVDKYCVVFRRLICIYAQALRYVHAGDERSIAIRHNSTTVYLQIPWHNTGK